MKQWRNEEIAILRRLRERFLSRTPGADYWHSQKELTLYDITFAERIGWKWDAVLRELSRRGWQPKSERLHDWGCGTAIASRCVVRHWPHFRAVSLHDRSALAARFGAQRLSEEAPQVHVNIEGTIGRDALLLVSHVLNELSPAMLAELLADARHAREIIWVEAGTYADSRALIDLREQLLGNGLFVAIAPCTHQNRCGLLSGENARHWCHHFSRPSAAFQDSRWAEFGAELGIDLRSLPYSFLVLQRAEANVSVEAGYSRIVGAPRQFKGYSKVLSCQAEGVRELVLQKRDAPELFRNIRRGKAGTVYRWTLRDGKISAGTVLGEQDH